MKKYTHLFFDLDHTLWDYEKNSAAALEELYREYDLDTRGNFSEEILFKTFSTVNDQLWDQFHEGSIDQDHIRKHRFEIIFEQLGSEFDFTQAFSKKYIARCPTMGHIFPGAITLLEHLKNSYELHIITNGFVDIQGTKMKTTGLDAFFGEVIISGNTGYRKPQKEIFEYALNLTHADPESSIMIGDSMESDIIGAKNANMDQVLFNPKKISHHEPVTYEIHHLLEMKELGF